MPDYEILVAGQLGSVARFCLPEVTVMPVPQCAVLNGTAADPPALQSVLDVLRAHGLVLLDVWINPG